MGRGEKNQSPFSNSFSIYCYEVQRRTDDPFSFLFYSFVFFLSLFLFVCLFVFLFAKEIHWKQERQQKRKIHFIWEDLHRFQTRSRIGQGEQ